MSNFWPSGIDLSDTQSPREILEVAKEDWYKGSEGVMELVLQDSESESGYPMIIVHAKHVPGNRTSRLLSVVHQLNNPYPVLIQPETENLPNSLKKSYYRPGLDASAVAAITGMRTIRDNTIIQIGCRPIAAKTAIAITSTTKRKLVPQRT